MTPSRTSHPSRWLSIGLWAAAALAAGYHLALEWVTIRLREPMGMWDLVYASIARVWPNQYQWSHYIEGHDNYGPGYPAFCRPFLALLGDPYVACRTANLAAIAASCLLLGWILVRNGCPGRRTAGLIATVYVLNAGSYSIQARPDFLVVLECLGVLAIGQLITEGRWRPVRAGALLGAASLAAYLTKPYAVLSWGAVVSFLVLFVRTRRAWGITVVSGVILVVGVGTYAAFNPLYVMETFFAHVAMTTRDRAWFIHQNADFAGLAFGVLIPGGLVMADRLRFRTGMGPAEGGGAGADSGPFWAWAALLGLLAIVGAMGWHTGAYLTYHLHLLLPPLAVLAGLGLRRVPRWLPWPVTGDLLILANLGVLMWLAPSFPRPDPGWERLRADVLAQPGRVVVDGIMEPFTRERADIGLLSRGLTDAALREPWIMPPTRSVVSRAREEALAYSDAQERSLFKANPPAAIYLEFLTQKGDGPGKQGLVVTPRYQIPYLRSEDMEGYVVRSLFTFHPYYFATNERRQYAGTWTTGVMKLVRVAR